MYRKERPKCRKVIERLLIERDCTLSELLEMKHRDDVQGFGLPLGGMEIQARKMLEEQQQKAK